MMIWYHIPCKTWHDNPVHSQKVGGCMVVRPNGAFADKLCVKNLGHKDVSSPLHVEPRTDLQLS